MNEHLHILTETDLVTGVELHSGQTLADAEQIVSTSVLGTSDYRAVDREQDWVEGPLEAIPLLESATSRRLLGHVPLSDLKEWIMAHDSETPLSQLAVIYRTPVRILDSYIMVCRQFLQSHMMHLSVVDSEGDYLGEVTRNSAIERVASSMGIGAELVSGLTFLIVESEKTKADSLDEILQAARAEGVRLNGYLELVHAPDEDDLTQAILLKLPAIHAHSFAETLRRMGYFNVCDFQQTPGSDELSRKAEEFLHFLDL